MTRRRGREGQGSPQRLRGYITKRPSLSLRFTRVYHHRDDGRPRRPATKQQNTVRAWSLEDPPLTCVLSLASNSACKRKKKFQC